MTFFCTLLFMFMVFWRPQEWLVPQLYGWPLLDVVVGVAVLAFLVEVREKRIRIPKGPVPWLLLGLVIASAMSHVPHTYFQGMIDAIADTWKICFFTFLFFCVLDRPKRLRAVARVFVVMTCVMAVHALLQKYRGYGFVGQRPMWVMRPSLEEPIIRTLFFGIFEDPNDLAQILVTAIPLCFVITKKTGPWSLLLSILAASLLVAGFLTTHSRGGMVAMAAVIGVGVLLMLPRRWFLPLLVVGALAALVMLPMLGSSMDISAHDRVVFWGHANQYFKANPLFGIGYGMFWQVAEDRASHNAFVLCYTELGIFGYWFWFAMLLLGVIGCQRVRQALKRPADEEQAYLGRCAGMAVASMCGFCGSAYFLSRAYVYPLFLLFAFLNALPLIVQRTLPEDHPPLINVKRDLYTYGTIGSVGSVIYIYVSILLLNKAWGG